MGPGLPGQRSVLVADDRAFVEDVVGARPGHAARRRVGRGTVDMFERMATGEIKACWIICTNPVASVANRAPSSRGSRRPSSSSPRTRSPRPRPTPTPTSCCPGALWAEADGVMINSERNLTLVRAGRRPAGRRAARTGSSSRGSRRAMGYADGFDYASCRGGVRRDAARFANPRTGYDLRGVTYDRLRGGSGAVAGRARRAAPQPDPLPQRRREPAAARAPGRHASAAGVPDAERAGPCSSPARTCPPPSCPTTTTRSCSTPAGCSTSGTR